MIHYNKRKKEHNIFLNSSKIIEKSFANVEDATIGDIENVTPNNASEKDVKHCIGEVVIIPLI